MSASNQQTLVELGATDRPLILEKWNYIPWESQFRRFLENKLVDAKEGELLESVYERLSTLVNVMDRNDILLIKVSINTKFLNSLQPECSKYVTLTRQNKILSDVEYDALLKFEPHVQAFKGKRAAKNHDSLALIPYSNAHSSQSLISPSYSQSPQPYYVTHPSSVVDYEEDY
ncbi:hypothetical protein Tco_0800932 [Tanacetum coccineum]|uniref:Gag-Pol polyprotein n=1 Tax=Tanacetum coccineum TaxID=301880 RepID=A0ABQ4ZUJ1_9ASTR